MEFHIFLKSLVFLGIWMNQCTGVAQNYVLTVEPPSCETIVKQGDSCLFTCDVLKASITSMTWTMTRTTPDTNVKVHRAACTNVPAFPSDYVTACTGQYYTLNITNVTHGRDDFTWTCTNTINSGGSNNITLGVAVPFSEDSLTTSPQTVKDGDTVDFTCTTRPTNPAAIRGYINVGGDVEELTQNSTTVFTASVTIQAGGRTTLTAKCIVTYGTKNVTVATTDIAISVGIASTTPPPGSNSNGVLLDLPLMLLILVLQQLRN